MRTQARRSRDRCVVLTCDLNVDEFKRVLGRKRVVHRGGVIAINGAVPVSVVQTLSGIESWGESPEWLAHWISRILRLKRGRGISPSHEGIQRLSGWMTHRLQQQPRRGIKPTEILYNARRWLPEYLDDVEIDTKTLHASPRPERIKLEIDYDELAGDTREDQALDLLEASKPKQRIRGLQLLVKLEDPDLLDWCTMLLDDDSVDVRQVALRTITHRCEDADTELLEPFAASADLRIRGAATAALARHAGDASKRWFRVGLTDPSPSVRTEMITLLPLLDPTENRELFELALYDPNPQVQQCAVRATKGKGFRSLNW